MAKGATRSAKQSKAVAGAGLAGYLRVLLGAVGLLAVAGMFSLGVWQLVQMPIERVVVTGDLKRVSRDQLQAMVTESLHGGFLGADLHYIKRPLEQLPWVFRVVIKRRWPNSLEIQVIEQLPIARWGTDGYLNQEGEVFHPPVMESIPGLPLLAGPAASQLLLMQQYIHMQKQLQQLKLQVAELTMNERGGLRARLTNGSELVFGRGDLEGKLQRFLGVYHADLAGRAAQVRSVDLRYSHGVAVAWNT